MYLKSLDWVWLGQFSYVWKVFTHEFSCDIVLGVLGCGLVGRFKVQEFLILAPFLCGALWGFPLA